MKTLRLQLRFLVPLVLTLVAAAYVALPLMDRLTLRWFARDLDTRATLVAGALSSSAVDGCSASRWSRSTRNPIAGARGRAIDSASPFTREVS